MQRRLRHVWRGCSCSFRPVTIHVNTSAAEIGLGYKHVSGVGRVEVVRVATGDLNTVKTDGAGQDGQVTLFFPMSLIIVIDGVG